MRLWGLSAVAIAWLVTAAQAAPLDLKQIPPTATWLVHIDLDAMRASDPADKAYREWLKTNRDFSRHLTRLCHRMGTDPEKNLNSLTLFGSKLGERKGVLVVRAAFDQKIFLGRLKKESDYKATQFGSHEIYSWTRGKDKRHVRQEAAAFWSPTVLIFGETPDEIQAVLEVLDGKQPGLAGSKSLMALDADIPAGTILVARAIGLRDAKMPWKSAIAHSQMLSLAAGEYRGEGFLAGKLLTKSPEIAAQVKQVIDGGRAMAQLQHADDADTLKMLERLRVNLSDKTVQIDFRAPADDVWIHLKAAAKAWAESYRHKGPRGPMPAPGKK